MAELGDAAGEVLVAVDGSRVAQAAADIAVQIAQRQRYAIRGLYVVDDTLVLEPYADYHGELHSANLFESREDLIAELEQQGETALDWLEQRCQTAGIPVSVEMLFGSVSELVLKEAADATLVALGRRGNRHASDPAHLGRHFRTIAHRSPVPLLVGGDESPSIKRLLLAYNGTKHTCDARLWTYTLQRALATDVVVLLVEHGNKQDLARRWQREVLAGVTPQEREHYRVLRRKGPAAPHVVAVMAETGVDLVVMPREHHPPLLEWISGSTLEHVLKSTNLPVLVA